MTLVPAILNLVMEGYLACIVAPLRLQLRALRTVLQGERGRSPLRADRAVRDARGAAYFAVKLMGSEGRASGTT